MLFISSALKNKPLALFDFSGSSPYQDYSGYGGSAVATGSPPLAMSFVSGIQYSRILSNTDYITFNTPVFVRGLEYDSFSLEAWVRVSSESKSVQKVLSHSDLYDGITIYGTLVKFSVPFQSNDVLEVSHDVQSGQRLHIVATYTRNSICLYINGELVAQKTFGEGNYTQFKSTSTQLVSGTTAGNQRIALGSAAIYYNALSASQVLNSYESGSSAPDSFEVPANFGGDKIPVAISNDNLFVDYTWDTSDKWDYPRRRNLNILNDSLEPQYINDIPTGGAWIGVVPLDALDYTSIYGMQLNWSGFPGLVETSVDANTWYVAGKGRNIKSVPQGFNPTNKELLIKVSFFPGWRISPNETYNSSAYINNAPATVQDTRYTSRGVYSIQSGTDIDSNSFFRWVADNTYAANTHGYNISGSGTSTTTSSGSLSVSPGDEIFVSTLWRDNISSAVPVSIVYTFFKPDNSVLVSGSAFNLAPHTTNQWTHVNGSIIAPKNASKISISVTRNVPVVSGSTIDIANTQIRMFSSSQKNILNESPFIDNLNIVGFISDIKPKFVGRTVTMNNAFPERDYQPLSVSDMSGVELATGGSLTISAHTSGQNLPARTIEVLLKRPVASSSAVSSMTGTNYKNGLPGTHSFVDGEWALVHTVASADVTGNITINGPAQISHIAIYPTALTADNIKDIMEIFVNSDFQRVDDSDSVIFTAGSDLVRIVDANGQIVLSG